MPKWLSAFGRDFRRHLARYAALGTVVCILAVGGYYAVSYQVSRVTTPISNGVGAVKDGAVATGKYVKDTTVSAGEKSMAAGRYVAEKTGAAASSAREGVRNYYNSWFGKKKEEDKGEHKKE